ncbi:ABC transporter ATP-binding protein [Clostridium hydrogenum]|uniref:ABC transporter ATP-binding protein n=1 Tax=Clostridium hydrogenum TaxID=2855764 RepID=UPI001F378221|nr:ABC transporter ATP-binding protein [Clostridium hydrogenum]
MEGENYMKNMNKKEKTAGDWMQFFRFLKKAKMSWILIIFATAVSMVNSEMVTRIPSATASIYSGDFSSKVIIKVITLYVITLIVSALVSVISMYAQGRSVRKLRGIVWKKMINSKTYFYKENDPENLLSAITNDSLMTVSSVVGFIVGVIPCIYYLVRAFMTVNQYSIKLMLSLFIMVPIYIIYAFFVGRWQYRTNLRIQTRIGGLTGYLVERLRNLNLIKAYSNEKEEEKNGDKTALELYHAKLQSAYINASSVGYILLTDVIATVCAVIWGALLLRKGEIDVKAWMAFFLFVPTINGQMRALVQQWLSAKGMQGYAARLENILNAPDEEVEFENTNVPFENEDISFKDVSFSYGEGAALSNINLTIPKGKVTAIVGLCGSGKTTLLNMLERLYDPEAGTIEIGKTDIKNFNISEYREHFAYIQQDSGVFSGSIREILTYGITRSVIDAELVEVTKKAGIFEYISSQTNGFDTNISLWGESLSGGQRQKLVIARELLKNKDIILLDEPTSALDVAAAREIQNILFNQFNKKTIITVTHDLSLMASVDQIVVMNNGKVEACGTHDELMDKCSLYHELVDEQSYLEVYEA